MTNIKGKVLSVKVNERVNKSNEKIITTLLNMYDENYNPLYISVKGVREDLENKFVDLQTIKSGDTNFYNCSEENIKIIENVEDKNKLTSILIDSLENVLVIDILENKEQIKNLVCMTEKNKIMKVKVKDSNKIDMNKFKEHFLNKRVNLINFIKSEFKGNVYYRIETYKEIKVIK